MQYEEHIIKTESNNNSDIVKFDNQNLQTNPAVNYILSLQSNLSKKTIKSFLNNVSSLLGYPSLIETPWHELRRHNVQLIINKLLSIGLSTSTVNTYLSAIKGVATEVWVAGNMNAHDYSMIKQVKSLRGQKVRQGRALNQEYIKKILNADDETPIGIRNTAIFSLMISCGLRRTEVTQLNIDDLDKDTRRLLIKGKGNEQRVVYIPEKSMSFIQKWLNIAFLDQEDPFFTRIFRNNHITNRRLTSQSIYFFMKNQQEKMNLPKLSPHDLRRTFATLLLEAGEDLITVKEAMGHKKIETTAMYDMRGEERLKQVTKHFDWL